LAGTKQKGKDIDSSIGWAERTNDRLPEANSIISLGIDK
jgi:hypothetical protein